MGTIDAYLHEPASRVIAWGALGLVGLGFVALIAALVLHARTKRWKTAEGRIVISEPGFDLVQRFQTDAPRNERVAKIVHEFSAAGKLHRSGRIRDAGDPPEEDIERLLKQYPVGSSVKVHYDPADPSKSALQINGPPKDLALGCLVAIAILFAAAAAVIWLIEDGFTRLQRTLPDAILPGLIALSATAIIFLVCFVAGVRRVREVALWPTTRGRIVQSGIHHFQMRRDRPHRTARGVTRITTAYMPVVEYEYRVAGSELRSRSIWADTEVFGLAGICAVDRRSLSGRTRRDRALRSGQANPRGHRKAGPPPLAVPAGCHHRGCRSLVLLRHPALSSCEAISCAA